jgi:hypothetical protein
MDASRSGLAPSVKLECTTGKPSYPGVIFLWTMLKGEIVRIRIEKL